MGDSDDAAELLFFDTFSHEEVNDINLDLVQFPKPVYITQVRIIPLGARVQADFPGGVRLGATNPSTFDIEFFVNDLGLPGASTFETLGHLRYNQNNCIHLECSQGKIPTDGLVLRGWYSTITLAVYGILTNSVNEPIASPTLPCEPVVNVPDDMCNAVLQDDTVKAEWSESISSEFTRLKSRSTEYQRDELEYGLSREPFHQHVDDQEQHDIRRIRRTSRSPERSPLLHTRTRSSSNERDYIRSREKSIRDWSRSPEFSSHRSRRKHSDRSRSEAEESHKWPRTPPASNESPARPRSPDALEYEDEDSTPYKIQKSRTYRCSTESPENVEEPSSTTNQQFEPIMSDEEILCDDEPENTPDDTAAAADEKEKAEINAEAAAAPPAIEICEPWKEPILKYNLDMHLLYHRDVEHLMDIFEKFAMQTKCDKVSEYGVINAIGETEREQFVLLAEDLINHLTYITANYKRRKYVIKQFFEKDERYFQQAANIVRIALDYKASAIQPKAPFKIRHLKIGARLAELLCSYEDFFVYLLEEHNFDSFKIAFSNFEKKFMALSIRLLFLKAIYSMVDTKRGLKHFLSNEINGYRKVMEYITTLKQTRIKFAAQSIIKKLHLYEAIESIYGNCKKLFVLTNYYDPKNRPIEVFQAIEYAFQFIMEAIDGNPISYQQPRRFMPLPKIFEIFPDPLAKVSFYNSLQSYLHQHGLAESLLVLLTNFDELPATLYASAIDVLNGLLTTYVGVNYFVDDAFEATKTLIQILTSDDESRDSSTSSEGKKEDDDGPNSCKSSSTSHTSSISLLKTSKTGTSVSKIVFLEPFLVDDMKQAGINLAFKVKTRYHLDAILSLSTAPNYDDIEMCKHMHSLLCHTYDDIGRPYTVEIFVMENNIKIFLDIIEKEKSRQAELKRLSPDATYENALLNYAVDMIDSCVRYAEFPEYLKEYGGAILELTKNHDIFEPNVTTALEKLYAYVKPLEIPDIFDYDDITGLIEFIKHMAPNVASFPGGLIMALRILRDLAVPKSPLPGNPPNTGSTHIMKYRYIAIELFSADCVPLFLSMFDALCTVFKQPGLHTASLATTEGWLCAQILLPCLQMLREILSLAISCRSNDYKDLTPIEPLVQVYVLLYYYPEKSPIMSVIDRAKQEIIQTLLAFTQPPEQSEELLSKSLWTLMFREVLKNINLPNTFIPGLQLLAELLPLPLPMPLPIKDDLQEDHKRRLITERKLWSAHLHPLSIQIARLIESLSSTSFPQLMELLQRVCMQLSDLAPNMTLLVTKTICNLLCNEWRASKGVASSQLQRLLNFSVRLCAFAPIKVSMLSLLPGKIWNLFQAVLGLAEVTDVVCKCQVSVHRILNSFLDSDISLVDHKSTTDPLLNLASSLPPKELIPCIAETVLANVLHMEVTHPIIETAVNNLVFLTDHDFTFNHLAQILKQRANEFNAWMNRVIVHNEIVDLHLSFISLLLLFRSLTKFGADKTYPVPPRTLKLSAIELAQIMHPTAKSGDVVETALKTLNRLLKIMEPKKPKDRYHGLLNALLKLIDDLTPSADSVTAAAVTVAKPILPEPVAEEEASGSSNSNTGSSGELTLPQAEGIVSQYETRPIFTRFYASVDDCKLTARYWLHPLPEKFIDMDDELFESIPCDLGELAKACFPPEAPSAGDSPRVLHLSTSPKSSQERTPTAPCFRTRRVEVEPTTGRPEKKVYMPSGRRGYPRTPPSRGDLFRSRPPNTSRPPSLHVDDFLALETCGAQPTGPTGYNKIPTMLRGARIGRNRGTRLGSFAAFRARKLMIRTSSPSTWSDPPGPPHYRSTPADGHYSGGEAHYSGATPYFNSRSRVRLRSRPYLR